MALWNNVRERGQNTLATNERDLKGGAGSDARKTYDDFIVRLIDELIAVRKKLEEQKSKEIKEIGAKRKETKDLLAERNDMFIEFRDVRKTQKDLTNSIVAVKTKLEKNPPKTPDKKKAIEKIADLLNHLESDEKAFERMDAFKIKVVQQIVSINKEVTKEIDMLMKANETEITEIGNIIKELEKMRVEVSSRFVGAKRLNEVRNHIATLIDYSKKKEVTEKNITALDNRTNILNKTLQKYLIYMRKKEYFAKQELREINKLWKSAK